MSNQTWNYIDSSCIECGVCVEACLCDAISFNDAIETYVIDKETCHECTCNQGGCANGCPVGAIVVVKSTR